MVAIRCQAVGVREGGLAWRGRLPPSGDRWLRTAGGYGYASEDIISTNSAQRSVSNLLSNERNKI
jgi:hypothetical protein